MTEEVILDARQLLKQSKHKQAEKQVVDVAPVLEVDVGNLLCFDYQTHNINNTLDRREQSTQCLQHLFTHLFNLNVVRTPDGPIAQLPWPTTPLPREKVVPQQRELTKWQKFAKEKGIKKKKRSRMVWDEEANEYKARWGKDRVTREEDAWVLPDKPGALQEAGVNDPFELTQKKKKERMEKQKGQEAKNRANVRRQRAGEALPVTIEMQATKKRPIDAMNRAITMAQRSTASMGEFDKAHRDEPFMKKHDKYRRDGTQSERDITRRIADNVIRAADKKDELDLDKAAAQAKLQEENQNRRKRRRV